MMVNRAKGGFHMPRKQGISDDYIAELYKQGTSMDHISDLTGISVRGLRYILNKNGVLMRTVGQPRKHKVNENFFKVWTHEMAWVLGLFVTDGHINKETHSIYFTQKDERILKLIAKFMDADYVLMPTGPTKNTPTIVINSKEIKQDLLRMGITPNKSCSLKMPAIPRQFIASFIRGVIDGDGYIDPKGYYMYVTTASLAFAQELLNVFNGWKLNSVLINQHSSQKKPIYRVKVTGKQDIIQLSQILYTSIQDDNFHIYKRVYLTQHSKCPYINKDFEIKDTLMKKCLKTTINKTLLNQIKVLARKNRIPINNLIEPELRKIISSNENSIHQLRKLNTNDRIEFRTTFELALLEQLNRYKNTYKVNLNQIIETAMFETIKTKR